MHKHHIKGKVAGVNKSRLCLHWQSQKRDPPNFGSGLAALPPRSILPQLVLLQTQVPARSFHREVLYDMRCIMIQLYKLKKLDSVLNSEVNIGHFVGHIHLNNFLINFSLPRTSGWV
jgi:hypothetical protein